MRRVLSVVLALSAVNTVCADVFVFSDPLLPGLLAEVEFTLLDPTSLRVRISNVSTGVPTGFSNSDQLLTGVSWDFGLKGACAGDPTITGGTMLIAPDSLALNFSTGAYGPGADVSGEWGYGDTGGSGALTNFVTTNAAHATRFVGANLDGPSGLSGPQGGLAALPPAVSLGGLGAIQHEVIATLTLSAPLGNLHFLHQNGLRVEFGSDAAFIEVPEPAAGGSFVAIALSLIAARRR